MARGTAAVPSPPAKQRGRPAKEAPVEMEAMSAREKEKADKAKERLAAAVRLRSAVALELVAGKVWALPIAVQSAPNRCPICSWDPLPQWHGFTLNGLGATALRAGAASHHACGREELPRCWADSETRPQGPALVQDGKAGPLAGLSRPGQPSRQPDASRSTVSAVPSLNWARAHETGSRPRMGPGAG